MLAPADSAGADASGVHKAVHKATPLKCRVCGMQNVKDPLLICIGLEQNFESWQGDWQLHCQTCYKEWYVKEYGEEKWREEK